MELKPKVKSLIEKRLNGGRDRTRTCDLLRVKNSGSFYTFYLLLWLSTNLGRLLSLSGYTLRAQ